MTTIVPPNGAETNIIADTTPLTSAKIEVIIDLDPALAGAETEVELPETQGIVEPNPPPIGAESDAAVNLASADRSTSIPVIPLSDLIADPELSDVTIWEVSRLLDALAAWASPTR